MEFHLEFHFQSKLLFFPRKVCQSARVPESEWNTEIGIQYLISVQFAYNIQLFNIHNLNKKPFIYWIRLNAHKQIENS